MKGRKVTMEDFLLDRCDDNDMSRIAIFVDGMNEFHQVYIPAYKKRMDSGEFVTESLHLTAQFVNVSKKLLGLLDGKHNSLTKRDYFDVVFTVQSDLLPVLRNIEAEYGDDVLIEGIIFSEAVKVLLEVK
jgi:hypothetical protein